MLTFALYIVIPIAVFWMLGLRKAVSFLIIAVIASVIFLLGSAFGLLLEAAFLGDHISQYVGTTLYTDSYANGIKTLGEGLAIPYIFIFDMFNMLFHYTFTHGTFILWICQAWSIFIILAFLR